MLKRQSIPLLEYDDSATKFNAELLHPEKTLPKKCVIAFLKNETALTARERNGIICGVINACTAELPVYSLDIDGESVGLVCGLFGAAGAARQLEELIAMGAEKFVACGSAGTLTGELVGSLIVCGSAVRDEGASFHYVPPSYEIEADGRAAKSVAATLKRLGMPFKIGKSWTTDALFKETEEKIALRREQGCAVVEMEASALMAVARVRGVSLAHVVYCSDDLSGKQYDHRGAFPLQEVRRNLIEACLLCAKDL